MSIEEQFHEDVMASIKASRTLKYNPTYFLRLVSERGAVGAAKHLVSTAGFQSGLITLWDMKRLDLSMECRMLNPAFAGLFTEGELAVARRRLADLRFIPVWAQQPDGRTDAEAMASSIDEFWTAVLALQGLTIPTTSGRRRFTISEATSRGVTIRPAPTGPPRPISRAALEAAYQAARAGALRPANVRNLGVSEVIPAFVAAIVAAVIAGSGGSCSGQ